MEPQVIVEVEEERRPDSLREREHAERNLGAIVIAIEFTLISVMVGVILFPLMDNATILLRDLRYEFWLYILCGLGFILFLWGEVIAHSLSFIGWPIDLGHNLLYIVFALGLGVQMHFLADPRGWYATSLLDASLAAAVILYDRHVIEQRLSRARGAAHDLFTTALARQSRLIRASSVNIANAILQMAFVLALPAYFIDRPGHLLLVTVQIISLGVMTYLTIRNFRAWSEPIVRKAMEELRLEGE